VGCTDVEKDESAWREQREVSDASDESGCIEHVLERDESARREYANGAMQAI
jgi:hypothetical protein